MTLFRILLTALVAVFGSYSAFAQDKGERTVEQYTCKDVMRTGGEQRKATIAFLHGFFLGQSGSSGFNMTTFAEQTDAFVNACLDNPKQKAVDAMKRVKS